MELADQSGEQQQGRVRRALEASEEKINVGDRERVGSLILGGALTLWGSRQKGLLRAAAVASGAGLLHRGATGHCVTYDLLRANTALSGDGAKLQEKRHAGFDLHVALTINASPEELRMRLGDAELLAAGSEVFQEVEALGNGRLWCEVELPVLGRQTWIIDTVHRGDELHWQTIEGSDMAHSGVIALRDAGGAGTHVVVRGAWNPPIGWLGFGTASLARGGASEWLLSELRRIKQLVESGRAADQSSGVEMRAR